MKRREILNIEEDGFVLALQMNIEAVHDFIAANFALRDKSSTAHFPLNQIQYRVGLVRILFIGVLHPRVEANVNPACHYP